MEKIDFVMLNGQTIGLLKTAEEKRDDTLILEKNEDTMDLTELLKLENTMEIKYDNSDK